jgi:hypothetical protein
MVRMPACSLATLMRATSPSATVFYAWHNAEALMTHRLKERARQEVPTQHALCDAAADGALWGTQWGYLGAAAACFSPVAQALVVPARLLPYAPVAGVQAFACGALLPWVLHGIAVYYALPRAAAAHPALPWALWATCVGLGVLTERTALGYAALWLVVPALGAGSGAVLGAMLWSAQQIWATPIRRPGTAP